jgi:hypothetical protein
VSRLVASMPAMMASRGVARPGGDDAAQGPDSKQDDGSLSLDLGPLDLTEEPKKPGDIIRR